MKKGNLISNVKTSEIIPLRNKPNGCLTCHEMMIVQRSQRLTLRLPLGQYKCAKWPRTRLCNKPAISWIQSKSIGPSQRSFCGPMKEAEVISTFRLAVLPAKDAWLRERTERTVANTAANLLFNHHLSQNDIFTLLPISRYTDEIFQAFIICMVPSSTWNHQIKRKISIPCLLCYYV